MELEKPENSLSIKLKFGKQVIKFESTKDADVEELQAVVYSLSMVNPAKQKLVFKGKVLKPGMNLSTFKIKKSAINMLLMGTPDDKVIYTSHLYRNSYYFEPIDALSVALYFYTAPPNFLFPLLYQHIVKLPN